MKKLVALAAVASLVVGGQALAQVDAGPDGLGMFFDTGATEYCMDFTGGQVNLYLMLVNCSEPTGISGWECHVTYTVPSGNFETGWTLPAGSLNVSAAPDFVVGLGAPLPFAPAMLLATYGVLAFVPDPMMFYVGPCNTPSIPGTAVYAAGDDPGLLIPMSPVSGNPELPVAQLNGGCGVIGNEDATFGQVKNLYR
jgi:hypothetical protein